uniref:Pentacotripeptide-repeat region of PRORP domain-containing protein n=1 Tax=Chaetoceros debilis TaxID=122233 RepID=A0A7S3V559_9STRA
MYFSRLILFSLIHEVFPFSSPALALRRNCYCRSLGLFSSLETAAGVIGDDVSMQVDVHIDDLFRSENLTELDTNTSEKIMKATHGILSTKEIFPNHSLIEDAIYVIESGWAKAKSKSGFEVIEQIILHLEQLEVELPISLYTMASDSARSPERAESMIRRAEKKYNAILDAFARESRNRSSLEKAERLLDTMIERNIANIISFNTLMNAYAKLGDESAVEDLFRKVESMDVDFQPDVFTYTTLIDAITRSSDFNRAERAETILAKMENMVLQGNKGVEPTTITYNAILHAWSSSGKRDAAKRAEQLLSRMEEIYQSGENEKAEPNVISYTSVIDSYARSGSSIDAERIFKRMEYMFEGGNVAAKPNAQSFNAVINSWVQNKSHPGAALRAESILVRMMQLSKKGNENVRPNVITFSTVINGWSKCASEEEGAAARAERVFKTMLREYKEGNESAKPNIISYCSLIDAYVKSNDSGSLERAEAIYDSISTAYMKGVHNYHVV